MNKLNREDKLLSIVLVVLICAAVLMFWPTNYYRISPGRAEALGPMIAIQGDSYEVKGEVMLTAVSMRDAKLLDYIQVRLFETELIELESKDFLPPGMDMRKYFELMQEMMEESQMTAKAVALTKAGYDPQITGEGVRVVDVLKEGTSYGKLKEGDIIVGIDGKPVKLLNETIEKIQAREVGQEVEISVLREEEEKIFLLKTYSLEDNNGGNPSIGVLITPHNQNFNFPIEIDINAGEIGGPSAGAMFTLEIFNRLTPEDITQGQKVAGTGTIDLDGAVGKIDGVRQKIVAAKDQGAEVFFSPAGNYEEAKTLEVEGIEVVGVENIDQIIKYLKSRG
ncbi:YlbL family protein [Halonatronum saccharophilum]|uniref:YlbL family protein n=1 Tax=Halonatronum saccharophilum TaxID=150060 RepID=UPI00047FA5D6|nr:PDZ domain-containing protein [Halonatronum saccharophilum]